MSSYSLDTTLNSYVNEHAYLPFRLPVRGCVCNCVQYRVEGIVGKIGGKIPDLANSRFRKLRNDIFEMFYLINCGIHENIISRRGEDRGRNFAAATCVLLFVKDFS